MTEDAAAGGGRKARAAAAKKPAAGRTGKAGTTAKAPAAKARGGAAAPDAEPAEPLETRAERAAVAAARSVQGVHALRPGLFANVIRSARGAFLGPHAVTREAGVSAQRRGDELHVHVQLAVEAGSRVLDVVREVRAEVAARVRTETAHEPVVHVIVTEVAGASSAGV